MKGRATAHRARAARVPSQSEEDAMAALRPDGWGIGRGPAGPEVRRLVLPNTLRMRLMSEARRAFPQECCGLLIGRIEGEMAIVTGFHPSPNRASDPRTGFEIDTALLFAAGRAARGRGEAVLGHYHSHPRGPAAPSETDRARAWVPGHVWLIAVPDAEEGARALAAWLAHEEAGGIGFRPLEIPEA